MQTQDFKYSDIQTKVKNDITQMMEQDQRERVMTAFNLPQHAHTGQDSNKVEFADLGSVAKYALISNITLGTSQILALNTTPVMLIPDPGNNSVVIVTSVIARLNYGSAAFAGANHYQIVYTGASGTQAANSFTDTFVNSSADAYAAIGGVATWGALTPVPGGTGVNGAIFIWANTGNPTTGNSTLTIVTNYFVVTFNG